MKILNFLVQLLLAFAMFQFVLAGDEVIEDVIEEKPENADGEELEFQDVGILIE